MLIDLLVLEIVEGELGTGEAFEGFEKVCPVEDKALAIGRELNISSSVLGDLNSSILVFDRKIKDRLKICKIVLASVSFSQ
jgi:hypothetical protein